MSYRLSRIKLLVLFFLTFNCAYCYQLNEAIRDALVNNSSIAASNDQVSAARVQSQGKISNFLPSAVATVPIFQQLDNNTVQHPIFSLQIQQNLFNYGGSVAEMRKGYSDYKMQQSVGNVKVQQIINSVVASYLNLLKAEKSLKLYKENLQAIKNNLEAEQRKFDLKESNKSDLAQAKAKYSSAYAKNIKAQSNEKNAKANFIHLTGKSPENIEFPVHLPKGLPLNFEEAMKIAKNNNSKLKAAYYQKRSLEFSKISAISNILPSVDLKFHYNAATKSQKSISVDFRVPLFQGGREYTAIAGAKYLTNQGRENYKEAYKSLKEELTIAWNEYQNSSELVKATLDLVESYEVALSSAKQEAGANFKTLLDVMDAEVDLLKAKMELIDAKNARVSAAYNLITITYGDSFESKIT